MTVATESPPASDAVQAPVGSPGRATAGPQDAGQPAEQSQGVAALIAEGVALYLDGQLAKARGAFEQAIAIDKDCVDAHRMRAEVLLRLGLGSLARLELEELEAAASRVLSQSPGDFAALKGRAFVIYTANVDRAGLLAACNAVLAVQDDVEVRLWRALTATQRTALKQQVEKAFADLRTEYEHHQAFAIVLTFGAHELVLQTFDKVISQHEDWYSLRSLAAPAALALGQVDRCLRIAEGALYDSRTDALARLNQSQALMALGRLDAAIDAAGQAIAAEPQLTPAYLNRGSARRGSWEQNTRPIRMTPLAAAALEDFARAIELNPEFAAPHASQGSIYRTVGRFEEAVTSLDRALLLDPGLVNAMADKALALSGLGRHAEARQVIDQAASQAPQNGFVLNVRNSLRGW